VCVCVCKDYDITHYIYSMEYNELQQTP